MHKHLLWSGSYSSVYYCQENTQTYIYKQFTNKVKNLEHMVQWEICLTQLAYFLSRLLIDHNVNQPKICDFNYDIKQGFYMTPCKGLTLKQQINTLDKSQLQYIYDSLHNLLSIFHKFNLVHRDIKPSNIMYCKQTNTVGLIDFGFSVHPDINLSFIYNDCGTTKYKSPELLNWKQLRTQYYEQPMKLLEFSKLGDIYALKKSCGLI